MALDTLVSERAYNDALAAASRLSDQMDEWGGGAYGRGTVHPLTLRETVEEQAAGFLETIKGMSDGLKRVNPGLARRFVSLQRRIDDAVPEANNFSPPISARDAATALYDVTQAVKDAKPVYAAARKFLGLVGKL